MLLAFHNKQEVKDFYLARVKEHAIADEIIQGKYWENGKGCAIGCTIHGSNHKSYEDELGIPIILARLEDGIFEGLPLDQAKLWPEKFLNVIKVGADLSNIWPKFAIWLLTDKDHGVIKFAKNDQQRKIIQNVSDLYSKYKEVTIKEWKDAAAAADAAAIYAAAAAAAIYADAAAYAAAAYADAAAYAAAAYAAFYAGAAKYQARIIQADKLLELLSECK